MLSISDEAIDRLIELAGMTGKVLVWAGMGCGCFLIWYFIIKVIL